MSNTIEKLNKNVLNTLSYKSVMSFAIISLIIEEEHDFDLDKHLRYRDKSGDTLGCGCTLCRLAHSYTASKKRLHRNNAGYLNDNYFPYLPIKRQEEILSTIEDLSVRIKNLKENKDSLKKLLLGNT